MNLQLSLVIPLFNEEESLPELCQWIDQVCKKHEISFEILMIDDGSTDNSWNVITELKKEIQEIKGIRFNRNYGKSAALDTGFSECEGEVVITMDADLQDSPDEIPELYDMIKSGKYDIVSGWKKKRYDPISKTVPSKLFNAVTRGISGVKLHDFNCGLKAYDHRVVKSIDVYGEMHRYIPAIAKWAGFKRITEKEVQHQERKYGVTKFGLERFVFGFLDLLSITFVSKFKKRPMHFFGTIGTLFFLIGFISFIKLGWDTVEAKWLGDLVNYRELTDRPLFYLVLIALVIGIQLFLAGFLGEMVALNNPGRGDYIIRESLGFTDESSAESV